MLRQSGGVSADQSNLNEAEAKLDEACSSVRAVIDALVRKYSKSCGKDTNEFLVDSEASEFIIAKFLLLLFIKQSAFHCDDQLVIPTS